MTIPASELVGSQLRFCDGAEPIYWSQKDTPETVKQVKKHNQVGIDQCDWGKN